MARLSKIVLVAALVAMLAMAPVLEARPLVEDSTAVVGATHQRQLRFFGSIFAFKFCLLKRIFTLGFYGCAPRPPPVVVAVPEYPTPKYDNSGPPSDNKYYGNH